MDIGNITLGDIEDIENYAGLPLSDIGEEKAGVSKLRTALVWIIKRKDNPQYTIEDARALPSSEISALLGESDSKK
jgi:hypothetical protein